MTALACGVGASYTSVSAVGQEVAGSDMIMIIYIVLVCCLSDGRGQRANRRHTMEGGGGGDVLAHRIHPGMASDGQPTRFVDAGRKSVFTAPAQLRTPTAPHRRGPTSVRADLAVVRVSSVAANRSVEFLHIADGPCWQKCRAAPVKLPLSTNRGEGPACCRAIHRAIRLVSNSEESISTRRILSKARVSALYQGRNA